MHSLVKKMLSCALALTVVVGPRVAFSCDQPFGGFYEPCWTPCPCPAAPSYYGCQSTCCSPCPSLAALPPTVAGCGTATTGTSDSKTTGSGTTDAGTATSGSGAISSGSTDTGSGTTGTTPTSAWSDADIAKVKAALNDKGVSGSDADKLVQGAQDLSVDPNEFADFIKDKDIAALKGDKARDAIQHYLDVLKKKMQEIALRQVPTNETVTLHSNRTSADALLVSTTSPGRRDRAFVQTATYYYTLMPVAAAPALAGADR
jgi:hypothetical protein